MSNKRIRVVHIVTQLDFGGAQFNTLHTASHLNKNLFEVFLLAGPNGNMPESNTGINVHVIKSLHRNINPFSDVKAFFELFFILNKLKVDIVHTHSSKAGILGRLSALFAGVPIIIHTFHGFGFNPFQNFLKHFFYVLLEKICAKFSAALIFVSNSNIDYAKSLHIGNTEKYELIRSGIKLSNYPASIDRKKIRAELGIDEKAIMVLSIGNTKPQKNPEHFIMAAAKLAKTRANVFFVFAGGGTKLEHYRHLAVLLGAKNQILLLGWRQDTPQLLAASDIYAMTSLWEGLPRSLVEAFASGLPAVCYNADGVADILEDGVNGFLIKKNDIADFEEKLALLLDDQELCAKQACAAKKTNLEEFDIDFMVAQQERLYCRLIDKAKFANLDGKQA